MTDIITAIIWNFPVLIPIYTGILCSFLAPYLRKLYEGKIEKFDWKYLYHLTVVAFWETGVSLEIFLNWTPPSGITSQLGIMVLAFAFGFGGKAFQVELEKLLRAFKDVRSA